MNLSIIEGSFDQNITEEAEDQIDKHLDSSVLEDIIFVIRSSEKAEDNYNDITVDTEM